MKKHLPNALTCINLFCGCLALVLILRGGPRNQIVLATYLVGIAAVADFFDGLAARALGVSSPIGKDLDSLADMVSFGVVPGAILYRLLEWALPGGSGWTYLPFAAFVLTVFSALRLAKFNNDTRQTDSFIGLPTPACTLVVAALPLILAHDRFGLSGLLLNPWFLLAVTALLSGLLVAELPLFALKFKNFSWADNRLRYLFILLALGLVLGLGAAGVPLAVLAYVAMSVPGRKVG
jgi:CDP-diacylglycerol---serine O-phosphatidyltransferase